MKKTVRIILIISCMLLVNQYTSAQSLSILWQKTIGGNLADGTGCFNCEPTIAKLTTDGGFVVGGTSASGISGLKTDTCRGGQDYWIVKLDSNRTIQWQKTFGGNSDDRLRVLIPTLDGGYIVAGTSASGKTGDKTDPGYSPSAFPDMWILKLNATGGIQWQRTLGGYYSDVPQSIVQNADSTYVIGAWSGSDSTGNKTTPLKSSSSDYWVVKLNSSGTILWQHDYGGQAIYSTSTLTCLNKTNDGGYILGGISYSGAGKTGVGNDKTDTCRGGNDYWIVKIDGNGVKQWDKTVGGSASDAPASILQTSDNGYLVAGYSTSDSTGDKTEKSIGLTHIDDYWIIKLDNAGKIQWQNTIGGYNADYAKAAQQTADGGYIIAGFSNSPAYADKTESSEMTDYWLVKLNAAGKVQWDKTIKALGNDYCTSVQETSPNNYVLAGGSAGNKMYDKTENSFGSTDLWILKVKFSANVGIAEMGSATKLINVYPNPAATKIFIDTKLLENETVQSISIIDITGKILVQKQHPFVVQEMSIENLPNGIYQLTLHTNNRQLVKTISVIH
jgi:hypothetical protein